MLVGPRAAGKTTTARRHAHTVVRLDRDVEAAAFRADPDVALAMLATPVLLDEWQMVPQVLGSIKRAVDDAAEPGSYLLTGSVRAELLEATWAATGRVVRLVEWGLCERELHGASDAPSFFDRLFDGELDEIAAPADAPELRGYIDIALRGMLPDLALQPSPTVRRRWLESYIDQLLLRDAALADEHRDPIKLRRYLTALTANTAGIVEHKVLYDAAAVGRTAAVSYDSLLELLFVTERLPAWHSNRLNRLSRSPKRYITEPAMIGALLGVDDRAVLRNGDLLGRLIDTFVVSQLRPEVEASSIRTNLYHLRLESGRHECDLIAERADGRILAFEIKANAAPRLSDAAHLTWLHGEIGDQFAGGVLFHTGPRPFRLADKIHALPIACLWGPIPETH